MEQSQCQYIVAIEKVGRSTEHSNGDGRLRFDISSCSNISPDPNNNKNDTFIRNLACFELQEEGIRSIKVFPAVEETFTVESIKGNGPDAAKSLSVQIIHKRNGIFRDSNENLSIYLKPAANYIPEVRQKLSTFQVTKKAEESGCITENNNDPSVIEKLHAERDFLINNEDLINYSQFSFRFTPILGKKPNVKSESKESSAHHSQTCFENTSNENHISNSTLETPHHTEPTSLVVIPAEENSTPRSSAVTLKFNTVLDDMICITIELQNLLFHNQNLKATAGIQNIPQHCRNNEKPMPYFFSNNIASNFDTKPKFRDLQDVLKAQAMYQQQQQSIAKCANNSTKKCRNSNRVVIVRRFVKAMVVHRLLSLGVQQLDCNEIIDTWEAKQLDAYWYYTLPDEDETRPEEISNDNGMLSPYISKPNSSLFRLSPSGHISKSIFSTFVRKVDTLKSILNSATCSLIQTSILLLLPEIKLLWGRQLETNRNPIFIHEWVRLIMLAAKELQPVAPEEIVLMVNRELKTLKTLAEDLYKATKKIHKKLEDLSVFTEEIFQKTLVRLSPKTLQKLHAFDVALKKKYSPDVIHFDPTKLHQIKILPADLFNNHVFISETKDENLLVKNYIDGFWLRFLDLKFDDRRTIFLALSEDLKVNLRTSFNTIQHLQELYTAGYPGSVKDLLKDVLDELNSTSKREDLTVLIKTSIVTHVTCLHEMLARLVCISEEVEGITKSFNQSLKSTSFNLSKLKNQRKKKRNKMKKSCPEFSDTDTCSFGAVRGYHKDCTTGIQNSNPQLVIPFSHVNADIIFKNLNP